MNIPFIAGIYSRFILKIFVQFTAENVLTLKKPTSGLLLGSTYITACDYCENSYIQRGREIERNQR